ncbi:MAG TPA: S41 family peptidase [Candidatus Acidoferrales bacterium]|nr:S41 family peptidase [Candidatus Acidoferrales bacterium]
MSEKLYSLLLRLFPSEFRQRFGEESIQLFRDRFREERGFWLRLRLWADLICDIAVTLPYEHVRVQAPVAETSLAGTTRSPSFRSTPRGPTLFVALFVGGAVSLAMVCIVLMSIRYVDRHPAIGPAALQRALNSVGSSVNEQSQVPPVFDASKLDAEERERVIDAAALNMREHYVDRSVGQRVADSLLAQERNGGYDGITDAMAFADLVTHQMQNMNADATLTYFQQILPQGTGTPAAERLAAYTRAMEQSDCTFETVQILQHNVGYFKLNSFPDPSVCRARAVSAMIALNHADAVIFDLRDNRGGFPAMTALIASYLFDHPEYWYNPRENTTEHSWTDSPVRGNRLADKPVYILTSRTTISGAEQFAYDLKMLKRAVIVGERTAGAAHAGAFFRIDDHFGMGITEVQAINPFSKSNWDDVGVEPDVKVDAADALNTAERLAEAKLAKK